MRIINKLLLTALLLIFIVICAYLVELVFRTDFFAKRTVLAPDTIIMFYIVSFVMIVLLVFVSNEFNKRLKIICFILVAIPVGIFGFMDFSGKIVAHNEIYSKMIQLK